MYTTHIIRRFFLLTTLCVVGTAFLTHKAEAITCTTGTLISGYCVVFLTSGTSWTVPSDWNSSSNKIEVIGGGGGGGGVANGGGGGAYSKATNVTLSAGSVTYAVGSAGGNGANGGDTYFCNSTSNCATIEGGAVQVGAKGGQAGAPGAGGLAASGVGSTKYSGGSGEATNGAGGGAGGPGGAGNTAPGDGNGGSGGGGSGGAGGSVGNPGSAGTEWDGTHGSGGGGGGFGGAGGAYGGGGGGSFGSGASGSQGLIVISYVPRTLSSLSKPPNNLGLVGYWSFNEGTSTVATDFSGNGNRGTLSGATLPTWISGKRGSALSFDGVSSNLALPNAPSGMYNDNCTIALWVRTTSDSTGTLFAASLNSPTTHYFVIESGNGASANLTNELISLFFDNAVGGQFVGGYTTTNRNELFDNAWHHVVVSIDSSTHMYVDGVEKTVTTGSGTDNGLCLGDGELNRFRIGNQVESDTEIFPFNGSIDEVRIYNRALALSEVRALYGSGAVKFTTSSAALQNGSSLATGLSGFWTFDGPDIQNTITDRSGQVRHGYYVGGATSSATTIGKLGQALDFNGTSSYVNVGNVGNVRSVAFWVQADDTTSRELISMDGTIQIELNGSSAVTATGFTGPTVYVDGVEASTIDSGWHHVVVTTGTDVAASTFQIGQAGGSFHDGKMDDVRVYSRALTASEAKQLFNLGQAKIH